MNSPQTIKDKLATKDVDQQSIATVLGCDLSTVHCTIYGKRRNRRVANLVALILGEPIEDLFTFVNAPPKARKPKPARPPKPTPEEIERLRIEVRMMLDTIPYRMPRAELAGKLSRFTGRPVNICSLSNYLSGLRKTPASLIVLQNLKSMIAAENNAKQNTHN